MYVTSFKRFMITVFVLSMGCLIVVPLATAQVSPSLGAAVSGSFQAHLHVGGDPNSSGAQSTSDIIFANLDKYGTTDFEAGAATILSEPSLLIVDTKDGNRVYGVAYAPIEDAVKGKISNFSIEGGDLKIKDSASPANEYKISLSALSSALDIKSIYTANDKLTANRSVNLDGKTLTFNGAGHNFSLGGTSFKVTNTADKTGHTNATLTSESLAFKVGADTTGAKLQRPKAGNSPFTISNTGTGGVNLDIKNNGIADFLFTTSKFAMRSADGKGTFLFNRANTVNGAVAFRNLGSGSFNFNPGDSGAAKLEVQSNGRIKVAYYGKSTFKGDASKDIILSVDASGNVRELTLTDVAKNLPAKSIPASALPETAIADKSLATDDQKLSEDRRVLMGGNKLILDGITVIEDSTNENTGDALFVKGKVRVTNSILSPIVRVTSDRRLKEDIQPFNDGIGIVRQVKTYNFRFKEDAEKIKHYGVIAQEIEAIDPDLVSRFTDEEAGEEYLSVHTNSLTYIMLDALKYLDGELAETKAEMMEMKADMLARIKALEEAGN